jgi:hypothetical protein
MNLWLKDTIERVLTTFAGAFLTVLVAAGTDYVDVSTWKAAAVAGGAAVFSVLKAAIASRTSNAVSPASLAR